MFAYNNAANAYREIRNVSGLENADPHKLVDMLFSGVLEKTDHAKGLIQQQAIREKGLMISKAIAIIEELRGSLDHEQGGELAENLQALYEYIKELLLKANLHNDIDALDEVHSLVATLQDGWRHIPESVRQEFRSS